MFNVIGAGSLQSAMVNGIRVGYTQVATLVTYNYDQVVGALGCQILHIDLEVAVAQIFGAPCKIETAEEVESLPKVRLRKTYLKIGCRFFSKFQKELFLKASGIFDTNGVQYTF